MGRRDQFEERELFKRPEHRGIWYIFHREQDLTTKYGEDYRVRVPPQYVSEYYKDVEVKQEIIAHGEDLDDIPDNISLWTKPPSFSEDPLYIPRNQKQ